MGWQPPKPTLVVVLCLVVLGCTGGTATSAPSVACVDTAAGGESGPSEAKDLEAQLPDSLNGIGLCKFSVTGDILVNPQAPDYADFSALVSGFGKTPADYAMAMASDPSGNFDGIIGAIRLAGVDGEAFLPAYLDFDRRMKPGLSIGTAQFGSKTVTTETSPSSAGTRGPTYIYAAGDALFFVISADQQMVAAALAALP